MTASPGLVTVAHGTRHATGNEVAREITERAAARLGVTATCSYVELSEPLFADVLAGLTAPAVAVPLLLSTGFHVRQDLPDAVAGASAPVRLGRPLGPDPLLAAAQVDQLVAAGVSPGRPVVLLAAGSSDPLALDDLAGAVDALAEAWGGAVRLATLSGLGPRLPDVVEAGDAVSPYLLAPGYFATRGAELARLSGASVVADVIGPHERVVDLVVARARALAVTG